MTTTATKIELVTEAIEALVLATVVAATLPASTPAVSRDRIRNGREVTSHHENIVDARAVLAKALAEAFAPTLRVLEGGLVPNKPASAAAKNRA